MKPYLFFFVLLLICTGGIAQIPQTHKIVYLKDGTNVKGTVTVNDSAGYVMVVDHYNETHYYQKSMVAKIDDEPQHWHAYTLKPKGYVCNIETGATDIFARINIPAFSFNILNSYLISPYASVGLGLGTDLGPNAVETFSIYADSRIYFIKSNLSPYLNLDFGYNAVFSNGNNYYNYYGYPYQYYLVVSHGFIFGISPGIRIAASKNLAITASAGYKLYDETGGIGLSHAATFKLGFQF